MARVIEARATPEEKAAVRALDASDRARHLANLADMKTAFAVQSVRLKSEAAEIADKAYADYDKFIEQFEAGLTHFAKQTGLHAEVQAVLTELKKEPDGRA